MRRTTAALAAIALLPLTACTTTAGPTKTEELTYQIDEPVTTLLIDARAASVDIATGEGPVTITEEHRYSRNKPVTEHRMEAQTLQLRESGCGENELRCYVGYRVRTPKTTSVRITAEAGAVKLHGLAGDVQVDTKAGAVEGRALTSAEVTVKTEAGAALLEFGEPPMLVRATTQAGAIELRVPGTTPYAVDVRTSVGRASVDVEEDQGSKHRIEVRTEVGPIKVHRSS